MGMFDIHIDKDKITKDGKDIDPIELPYYIGSNVTFSENTTLGDIWKIIEINKNIFSMIFYDSLGGHKLDKFIEYVNTNKANQDKNENIKYLEIYCEVDTFIKEDKSTTNISYMIHGVGDDGGYSLSFEELPNLMDYIIKIKEDISLSHHDLTTKYYNRIESKSLHKLFNVFSAIFEEISFFGYPQDGKAKDESDKLSKIIDDIENGNIKLEKFDLEEWDNQT